MRHGNCWELSYIPGNRLPFSCVQTREVWDEGISQCEYLSMAVRVASVVVRKRLNSCVRRYLSRAFQRSSPRAAFRLLPLEVRRRLSGTLKAFMKGSASRLAWLRHHNVGWHAHPRASMRGRRRKAAPAVAPGKFSGFMSEASGPVTIEQWQPGFRQPPRRSDGGTVVPTPTADQVSAYGSRARRMVVARFKTVLRRLLRQAG